MTTLINRLLDTEENRMKIKYSNDTHFIHAISCINGVIDFSEIRFPFEKQNIFFSQIVH